MEITAGILAGGYSSRMGDNKIVMDWRGHTFLETVLEACSDLPEIILSVDEAGRYSDLPYPRVVDELKGFGPLEGIYQILRKARTPYVLILAADMPLLTREFIRGFLSLAAGDADCAVLRLNGKPQPMCSVYSRKILPIIEKARAEGIHKPGFLFPRVNTRYVEMETTGFDPMTIANINTPEEYEEICMKYGRRITEFAPFLEEKTRAARTMVCYLDGLGYRAFKRASAAGALPFMSEAFKVSPMRTTEPPLTNPAFAAMITGALPEVSHVFSHKDSLIAVPTIFAGRTEENTAFLEGDTRILKTEISPVLHVTRGGRSGDYWIFKDALKEAAGQKSLIFAHFHEIDDAAHEYGPYSSAYMEKLRETDAYLKSLSEAFEGTFLLISDHGVLGGPDGGSHGETREGQVFEDRDPEEALAIWGERHDSR